MKLSKIKEIRNSLFTRLTITSLVTGILIVISVWAVSGIYFRIDHHAALVKHIESYASYIIKDIGKPPDTGKAAVIAGEKNIFIEIKNNDFLWRSSGLDFSPRDIRHPHITSEGSYGTWDRRFVFIIQRDGYTYTFIFNHVMFSGQGDSSLLFLFLALLCVIIAISYLIIRHMLLPLKGVSEGVRQNISGNFKYRIPEMKDDEIGKLAESFNRMTDKIESMIESREQLLRDVSHEFRSPLTRMKVALELYGDENIKADIGEDILILETMITEVLESERLNSLSPADMEKVDLNRLVQEVIAEFDDSGNIGVHVPGKDIIINSKSHLLKIAFRNIVQNGLKYADPDDRHVEITVAEDACMIKITVSDNGPGIPDSEKGRIFEPFYRIDKSRSSAGGYGLGLHIAKKSVEALGGKIEFTDSGRGGAAVVIILEHSLKKTVS